MKLAYTYWKASQANNQVLWAVDIYEANEDKDGFYQLAYLQSSWQKSEDEAVAWAQNKISEYDFVEKK